MMALRRPTLWGRGRVAAARRPARRAAVRVISTARGRRGCAAVGLGVRGRCRRSATAAALILCGGGGGGGEPCRGLGAAPVALRQRCARRRAVGGTERAAGSGGFELGGSLVPFGAVLGLCRSSFSVLLKLLAASRVAGFLGPRRRRRLRLLGIYLGCMTQQILEVACPCRCAARERRPDTTLPLFGCSPSLTSSFLTAFSRAARRGGRTPMILTCRAPPKYSGCVVEPQTDGRGSLGVSRRLPFEVAFWA